MMQNKIQSSIFSFFSKKWSNAYCNIIDDEHTSISSKVLSEDTYNITSQGNDFEDISENKTYSNNINFDNNNLVPGHP